MKYIHVQERCVYFHRSFFGIILVLLLVGAYFYVPSLFEKGLLTPVLFIAAGIFFFVSIFLQREETKTHQGFSHVGAFSIGMVIILLILLLIFSLIK